MPRSYLKQFRKSVSPLLRQSIVGATLIVRVGFFYIIGFGLTQEQVDRQFAIGKKVFELPTDEKMKYRADLENGGKWLQHIESILSLEIAHIGSSEEMLIGHDVETRI